MTMKKRIMLYDWYEIRERSNPSLEFVLKELDRETLEANHFNLLGAYVRLTIESGLGRFTVISEKGGEDQAGQLQITNVTGGHVTFTAESQDFWLRANNPHLFWIEVSQDAHFIDRIRADWPEGKRGQIRVI